ncbi:MAG: MTH1187 family thiamine-binding protein [Thermoproteota archaeon]
MTVIVELSIIPMGTGTSVSKILAHSIREIKDKGVKYEITPMCTVFETGSIEEALDVVKAAHEAILRQGVKRVITAVKLDDRRDVERSMGDKVRSLKKAVESIRS